MIEKMLLLTHTDPFDVSMIIFMDCYKVMIKKAPHWSCPNLVGVSRNQLFINILPKRVIFFNQIKFPLSGIFFSMFLDHPDKPGDDMFMREITYY